MHIWCFVHTSDQRVERPLSKLMPNKMPTWRAGPWLPAYQYHTSRLRKENTIHDDIFYILHQHLCQTRCQLREVNRDCQPININQCEERKTLYIMMHDRCYILHRNRCQTSCQHRGVNRDCQPINIIKVRKGNIIHHHTL